MEHKIRTFVADSIRPFLEGDGGDIDVIAVDEGSKTLRVRLVGACAGCPSSSLTLFGRVEALLQAEFGPEWHIELG